MAESLQMLSVQVPGVGGSIDDAIANARSNAEAATPAGHLLLQVKVAHVEVEDTARDGNGGEVVILWRARATAVYQPGVEASDGTERKIVEEPVRPEPQQPPVEPDPDDGVRTVTGTHHQAQGVGFRPPRGRVREVR